MIKKIISVFVAFTLLFSVSSVFAFAEGEADVVKNEIETNYPNLDLTSLPGNKPIVIGAVEDVVDETCLYLYIYNPGREAITGGHVQNLNVELQNSEGKTYDFSIFSYAISIIDKSGGSDEGLFYKARLSFWGYSKKFAEYNFIHTFSWNQVIINTTSESYLNCQNCVYNFEHNGDETTISYDLSEVVTLDVHHTWYRSKGKVEKSSVFDEIHTVYFSIPDEYIKYYPNLYSVACTYTKKHTTPIIVGTDSKILRRNPNRPDLCIKDVPVISKDYNQVNGLVQTTYNSDFAANVNDQSFLNKYNANHYFDDLFYYFHCEGNIENSEDLNVSSEELLAYIDKCESANLNLELFDNSEFLPWSEKTIMDTFDSISYSTQIGDNLLELVDEYGLKVGWMFYWYRNNPTKLQELAERYLVDVPDKDINDASYLFLFDDDTRNKALTLSDQEFADEYLINVDDVPEFRNFLANNNNVLLYRFDIVDYYSEEVVIGTQTDTGSFIVSSDDHRFVAVQQYLYYDFRVIDVTFQEDDTFVSLCVNSHPQNFSSDPGLEEDDPPIEWEPDLPQLGNDLRNSALRAIISVAAVLLGCIVVIVGFKYILNAAFSPNSKKKNE